METIFSFVLNHFKIIELFVFWYPVSMGMLWVIGGFIYYWRLERKDPLPLIDTPLVSVLVPAYNEGDNIITTVERLNDLNYPNYEIIIINDGSSDESPGIERELAKKYPKVRFIDLKENAGKANALYLGYMASKGEFLVCVDGDSYLDKDCLRYMIPHFINPNNGERVGAVTGNPRVRNRSSLLAKIQLCEYASIISLIKRTQRIWGKVMTVSGVVVAFRKQALMDCGLWDRDMITEDIGVTWKLERNFWDVRYEPRALCWMLVPESVKGLFKQRKRWAQGGQEVMFRHASIFKSWRRRRLFPIFLEQAFSLLWVVLWLLLTVTELFKLTYDAGSYLPYLWKSQFLSVICMLQFTAAILLERQYDKEIMRNMIVAAWYPLFYWILSGLVAVCALPSTIKSRGNKLATWSSPDRGIGTADSSAEKDALAAAANNKIPLIQFDPRSYHSEKEPDDDIIKGNQKLWKKIIEVFITIFAWAFILVYLGYCIYGAICLKNGINPVEFFIYNKAMLLDTGHILYITGLIFVFEVMVMIFWKEYNRIRYGKLTRRKFKPPVTVAQMSTFFEQPVELIERMQNDNITVLEKNLFSPDFKGKPLKVAEMENIELDYIASQALADIAG